MKMAPSRSRALSNINSNYYRRVFFFLNLAAVLVILSIIPGGVQARPQAQVGYGPGFDACGDNCQTQLLHFCTQGRDAQQQKECWCGEDSEVNTGFKEKMNACLASCDPQVTDAAVQQDRIVRYKEIVCKGSTAGDEEFSKYYSTRYTGKFVPQATAAAPPPVITAINPTTISTYMLPTPTTTRPSTKTRVTSSAEETDSTTSSTNTESTDDPTPTKTSTSGDVEPTSSEGPAPTRPSAEPTTEDSKKLNTEQIVGISIGAISGVALIAVLILVLILVRRKCRRPGDLSSEKRFSSSSRGQFSPISPMARQMRDTPEGFSPDFSAAQRIRRALAAFLAWRPETGKFDIDDQLPYTNKSNRSPEPPIIRVTAPRKMSISPPMMSHGSLGTGITPRTLRQVTPPPEPAYLGASLASSRSTSRSTSPQRKDVILPPIPPAPVDQEVHAITTPSGYGDPNFYTYYGNVQPRPQSDATEMDLESSECSSEYSNSEWTDYDESTFNRSASQAAIDALVQEVDRRNQRLAREGSRRLT